MRPFLTLTACLLVAAAARGAELKKTPLPPLPRGVCSFGAAVAGGHLYVYGGHCGKPHTYSTEEVVGTFHRAKLDGSSGWESLPGGPGMQGLAMVSYKGKLYRVGGVEPRNKPGDPAALHSVATFARFDPAAGTWEKLPDLPAPRSSHDAVVLGDTLYVVGGWCMKGPIKKSTWHDTMLACDLSADNLTWKEIKQPFERRALSAAAHGGKIYVLGGLDDAELYRTIDVFDPKAGNWAEGPRVPGNRMNCFSPASAVVGGELYLNPADGTVYRLDGDDWEPLTEVKRKRIVHRMLADAGRLLVVGGSSRGDNVEMIECVDPAGAVLPERTWAGFRNRGGNLSMKPLPVEWTPEGVKWKTTLPAYGQSSPAVWGDTAYVTAVSGNTRDRGHVIALDAATGQKKWQHDFSTTQKAKMSFSVSKAAPTPVVDADGVYCFFEGGNLLALTHGGEARWSRSLVTDYGRVQNGHGLGGSPAQTAEAVIVLVADKGESYLLAASKATGKTMWKKDREKSVSWTTPVVTEAAGKELVLVSSNGAFEGYDAATGERYWRVDGLSGNTVASPTVAGDVVVLGGSPGRGARPDGAIANMAFKLMKKAGKPACEELWKSKDATSSFATPLAYEGHAYFINRSGVVACVDLKTGETVYEERVGGSCWASPLAAGGKVYFFGKDGTTTVIAAGGEFKVLATSRMWPKGESPEPAAKKGRTPPGFADPILYGVAAADGAVYARTGRCVFRVGE